MTSMYIEKAIKLVDIKENGVFEISEDGVSFLSSLKNKRVYD